MVVARTPPRCGGYIQSLKWRASKGPIEPLRRGVSRTTPARANRVRERQAPGTQLDVDPGERGPNPVAAPNARRSERDDLVLSSSSLGQPAERAVDVVADPVKRVRQRADVEDDPHSRGR